MSLRWRLILLLLPLTAVSFYVVYQLEHDQQGDERAAERVPDYTMTDLDSLNMDVEGDPETRLRADFMAHFEDQGETELTGPRLEMFRPGRPPLHVRADRGWVTSGNEVILLRDNVRFWEPGEADTPVFEITTSAATVYPERDMAETDQPATLTTPESRTDSVGMRAYMKEGRIEMLSRVKTVLEASQTRPDRETGRSEQPEPE
ncbi:lipopolysaccharide export system protein LptC [Methylohalomonas lacus]|uniref:Lipopolysaccharide export system protein LptC n=1 Tax=Methylohalomonas lacus TaxID=398773 RepID=A0AAE3HLX4_9GAMM|nr:LPS export ABC transporter periplasmic protein LptC [Methylohalomonas lacus]MCS3904205.1 lipopolysaccharide export system protein LptC [Methylohalomonas lacus]